MEVLLARDGLFSGAVVLLGLPWTSMGAFAGARRGHSVSCAASDRPCAAQARARKASEPSPADSRHQPPRAPHPLKAGSAPSVSARAFPKMAAAGLCRAPSAGLGGSLRARPAPRPRLAARLALAPSKSAFPDASILVPARRRAGRWVNSGRLDRAHSGARPPLRQTPGTRAPAVS